MASQTMTVKSSNGHVCVVPWSLMNAPAGATIEFGDETTRTQVVLSGPTPGEARDLAPPQRREARAYRAGLLPKRATAAPVQKESVRQVREKPIQKTIAKSVFKRLGPSPQEVPELTVTNIQGHRQVTVDFPSSGLSRRARKNKNRKINRAARREVTNPIPIRNSFSALENIREENVVSRDRRETPRFRVKSVFSQPEEATRATESGSRAARKQGHHHDTLHRRINPPTFKRTAPGHAVRAIEGSIHGGKTHEVELPMGKFKRTAPGHAVRAIEGSIHGGRTHEVELPMGRNYRGGSTRRHSGREGERSIRKEWRPVRWSTPKESTREAELPRHS